MPGDSRANADHRDVVIRPDGGESKMEEQEDENEQVEGEPEEESGDDQETEQEGEETEEAEEENGEESEAEEEDEKAEQVDEIPQEDEDAEGVHSGGAEVVYEDDNASGVLHLDLDGLALDLLGLEVHLDEVVLDVSARPGDNNLLGNLLDGVTGLLDGLASSPMEAITDKLGDVKEAVGGYVPGAGDIKEKVTSLGPSVDDVKERFSGVTPDLNIRERLSGVIPSFGGIRERLGGFVPSIGGEREGEEAEDGEETPGIFARVKGWFGEKVRGLVSMLPLEQLLATIVRQVLEAIIEQVEDAAERAESGGQEAEAEA